MDRGLPLVFLFNGQNWTDNPLHLSLGKELHHSC